MRCSRWLLLVVVLFCGCSAGFQGIKFRAEGPPIGEAYRSLSLALTVDGYGIRMADPARFSVETEWRALQPLEKPLEAQSLQQDARLSLHLETRGKMYDVFLLPTVRTITGSDTSIAPAPATHPLRLKWQRTMTTLLRKEQKEED